MQVLQKELCHRPEWRRSPTIPSTAISPDPFDPSANNVPLDAAMTLGGLPPLRDENSESNCALTSASGNEIVTAFASLDAEVEESRVTSDAARSSDFQCRYRRGKCSRPRTLKKNGSMHTYCEYHRQRSVRNQRVFDHKRRHQRQTTGERQEEGHGPESRD
uniref:Uncharacterized protein n=1 Tax=Peronospora matthiolae TaxID=2874970 RepID=A0AAV1TMC3_9STRA